MTRKAFKQAGWTGLCGPYSVANALALLFPAALARAPLPTLVRQMTDALPVNFRTITREGTDRPQMDTMLDAAMAYGRGLGWPAWEVVRRHPRPGMTARQFWDELAAELERERGVAIIGFGSDDRPNTPYEPHWSCVEKIGREVVKMRDSDEYDRIRRARTGIGSEGGWEIEDCYILRPARACRAGNDAGELREAA